MISLRTATESDADAVVAVWHACDLTRPWYDPHADFSRAIGHSAATIFLAETDGEIVGTAMTGYDGHRGWIYYLGVAPDHRGRGAARQLLDGACDWLTLRGCPKVELMLREGNPATGLYEHLNWELQPVRVFARSLG